MARERRAFGRLRKLPSGRWQAGYIGPDARLYSADSTFAAKLDAEAWLADRRREIDRDLWSPAATREQKQDKRRAEVTLEDYAEPWLQGRRVKGRPLRPRTVAHYRSLLDDHILPVLGHRAVRSLTVSCVDRWYAGLDAETPTVRAHAYSLLRTILETARIRDRLTEANPCAISGAGTVTRAVTPKPATGDQIDRIATEMPERLRLMVLLAGWCALRFGELVELRRKDIDLDDNIIRVTRAAVRTDCGWVVGDPKSDAGIRDVAIPPHLAVTVKRHLANHVASTSDSLLFPAHSGGHLQPSTLYRHFYRARETVGRQDLRWHDLRHSGAVLAAQTGATLAELMARLGHSTPQAAMRYQHAAQGRDKQIAAMLSKRRKSKSKK